MSKEVASQKEGGSTSCERAARKGKGLPGALSLISDLKFAFFEPVFCEFATKNLYIAKLDVDRPGCIILISPHTQNIINVYK